MFFDINLSQQTTQLLFKPSVLGKCLLLSFWLLWFIIQSIQGKRRVKWFYATNSIDYDTFFSLISMECSSYDNITYSSVNSSTHVESSMINHSAFYRFIYFRCKINKSVRLIDESTYQFAYQNQKQMTKKFPNKYSLVTVVSFYMTCIRTGESCIRTSLFVLSLVLFVKCN